MKLKMIGGFEPKRKVRKTEGALGRGWIALVILATTVAFTGGASRFDAIQIVPLRTLSALFLVSSLFLLTKEKLALERTLVFMFGCFILIAVLQLVPLPPWLWKSLPGRADFLRLDAVLGLEEIWRPLTLTPMRTWNVLGSLVVPAAGLLLAVSVRASSLMLLRIVAGLGFLNALLGLIQLSTKQSSVFYIYEVTNRGSPVGILANENHFAIFAACSMLVVTLLGLRVRPGAIASWGKLMYPAAFLFMLFVSLAGGSRAGFLAAIAATLASITMLYLSPRLRQGLTAGESVRRRLDERPRLIVAVPIIVVTLTAASFVALNRAPAFRDILVNDNLADLRWSLWPPIAGMLETHWLLGSGFGSFEQVYHIYEPSALLMPQYVNQAHNDWVQLIIEGGVLAGLLVVGLFVWLAKRIGAMALLRTQRVDAIFWMSLLAIVAGSSTIDYPLRTPLFQLVMVWLLLAISQDARDMKTK